MPTTLTSGVTLVSNAAGNAALALLLTVTQHRSIFVTARLKNKNVD